MHSNGRGVTEYGKVRAGCLKNGLKVEIYTNVRNADESNQFLRHVVLTPFNDHSGKIERPWLTYCGAHDRMYVAATSFLHLGENKRDWRSVCSRDVCGFPKKNVVDVLWWSKVAHGHNLYHHLLGVQNDS